ncbi:MAG: lysophospholipid acyltransferase family protein, partial [Dehalococcoidia bacterium]
SNALRWILRTLQQDHMMGIFPEGTRNPNAMHRVPTSGVAYIALKTHSPILPVGITGTERIPAMWRILFPFCHIKVRIGEPFSLPPVDGKLDEATLGSLTEMIMLRVAALLPEEYRGEYSQVSNHAGISRAA